MLRTAALALSLLLALAPPALRAEDEQGAPEGVAFVPGPPPFADLLARAKAERKDVFLDFYTDWCGWCRVLEEETFPSPEAARALAPLLCARYDAESDLGQPVAERYGVHAFPTLLVVDAEGREVDRIVGFRPTGPFVEEIERIRRDEDTLRALRRAYEGAPEDPATVLAYVRKVAAGDAEEALRVLDRAQGPLATAGGETIDQALLARADALAELGRWAEALAADEAVVARDATTAAAAEAALGGATAARFTREPLRALQILEAVRAEVSDPDTRMRLGRAAFDLHVWMASEALRDWGGGAYEADDAEELNNAAWTAYVQDFEVGMAIEWARKAVEIGGRQPHVLDTLASLLAKAGDLEEAVDLEREAWERETDPDARRTYYESLLKMRALKLHRGGR